MSSLGMLISSLVTAYVYNTQKTHKTYQTHIYNTKHTTHNEHKHTSNTHHTTSAHIIHPTPTRIHTSVHTNTAIDMGAERHIQAEVQLMHGHTCRQGRIHIHHIHNTCVCVLHNNPFFFTRRHPAQPVSESILQSY